MKQKGDQILDYATRKCQRVNWRYIGKRLGKTMLVLIVLGYALVSATGTWHDSTVSTCTKCGVREHHSDYYIPLTSICYHSSHSPQSTPVSMLLERQGIRANHRHQFVVSFGNGGPYCGFGFRCTLYRGRHVDPVRTAEFLEGVIRYSDRQTALKWIDIVLDPDRGRSLSVASLNIPQGGFADQISFQTWWSNNQIDLDAISKP